MKTKRDAIEALKVLRQFIGHSQWQCLGDACRGEEKQYLFDLLCEYAGRITAMPKTYEQEGKGDQAVAHLHYFTSGCDWWITEKDMETPDSPGQHQAFGMADLGDGGEMGYISIVELLGNGAELDLHWTPKTLAEVKCQPAVQELEPDIEEPAITGTGLRPGRGPLRRDHLETKTMKEPSQPLTYPARPVNGGHLQHALRKVGQWSYEPKYNGWRAIVHCPTGAMWNRHGQRLSIAREFTPALATLKRSPFEWLDVEALERRHNLGRGSLIVLDCPDAYPGVSEPWHYSMRVNALYNSIIAPGLGQCLAQTLPPENDMIYIPPVFGEGELDELWRQLQEVNQSLGCVFYEGVVAKKDDSLYPLQLHSPDQTTATWMKHRFIK